MKHFLRNGILAVSMASIALAAYARDPKATQPVPDEATAIRVAEAALVPIYGKTQIESERPFTAKLTGNVWHVWGYLPPTSDGGVAEVRIDRRDGHILRIIHGK